MIKPSKDLHVQNNFNISSEKLLENRISAYNLTSQEKSQIWQIVGQRDDDISQLPNPKRDREVLNGLVAKEVNRLKLEGQPQTPQRDLTIDGQSHSNRPNLKRIEAQDNVLASLRDKSRAYEEQAELKITAILNKAYEDGRGPQWANENGQDKDINRKNENDQDNEPGRDR